MAVNNNRPKKQNKTNPESMPEREGMYRWEQPNPRRQKTKKGSEREREREKRNPSGSQLVGQSFGEYIHTHTRGEGKELEEKKKTKKGGATTTTTATTARRVRQRKRYEDR
jgi:hypothetical protein